MNKSIIITVVSYVLAIVAYWFTSAYVAIAIPAIGLFVSLAMRQRSVKRLQQYKRESEAQQQLSSNLQNQTSIDQQQQQQFQYQQQQQQQQQPAVPQSSNAAVAAAAKPAQIIDPELASALEYIGVIEDMILLEGEHNNLDDEIVQKTLALLTRLNRLVPDLVALGDERINHNIVRLVRKDLNSTINPFLRLSGEAKRQNRRLLLDGIKDIDSKLTFYTKTIEQKDLMELHTKAELIQQRYRLND